MKLSFNFFIVIMIVGVSSTTMAQDPSLRSVYNEMQIEMDPSDYTIHDPSRIITVGNKQMIAVTGKAQEDGYNCGIETWWRKIGGKRWKPGQCLFQTKPEWIADETPENDGAFWAPSLDINEESGKVTLIYSVTDMTDDEPNSCMGIASASGSFPNKLTWEDHGKPMACMTGSDYENERSVIDPSVFWGMGSEKGKLFLVTGGGMIIGGELNPSTHEIAAGKEVTELARGPKVDDKFDWIEAAYIHPNPDTGYYYLFANWGACCSGMDSTYEIRVGRSKSPMGPFLDKKGRDMMNGGGSLVLKSGKNAESFVIGPGHAGIWTKGNGKDFMSFHYYDGRREGNSWIAEKRVVWRNGWPRLKKVKRAFPEDLL